MRTKKNICFQTFLLALSVVASLPFAGAWAADWPTYRHDIARSGVADEELRPTLEEAWSYQPGLPPQPAWPAPAPRDYFHRIGDLKPEVTFDRAFHAVSAGGRVFFASSADDRVVCLNADTGAVEWTFFAEAPIRLAPTLWTEFVYVASDDGVVYCLHADTGRLKWKYRAAPSSRLLPGNGRVISEYPVRTGVLLDNGVAYCCAGIFNPAAVVAVALDAKKGKLLWSKEVQQFSPQGYLSATSNRLFIPTGRTTPAVIDRANGDFVAQLEGVGGAFAVLAEDVVAAGTGRRSGNELSLSDAESNASIATCEGRRMLVSGPMAYILTKDALKALDREKYLELSRSWKEWETKKSKSEKAIKNADASSDADKETRVAALKSDLAAAKGEMARLDVERAACYRWSVPCASGIDLILSGEVLYVGGEDIVTAFSIDGGREMWLGQVQGRAYGLGVANGKLLVSTDSGFIHCFVKATGANRAVLTETASPPWFAAAADEAGYAQAAEKILKDTGITQGYAIVLDSDEGRLAYELARQSRLQVVGLEHDAKKVSSARTQLLQSGLYGARITILEWDGKQLPFTPYMANLVVRDGGLSGGKVSCSGAAIKRILRPIDGTALLPDGDWKNTVDAADGTTISPAGDQVLVRRGAVPGAGEWTQLYCDSGHTAASTDELQGPLTVQWFGEPGPSRIIDRHHRPMSPLFDSGRLFINGNEVLYALDAYNGFPLWTLETPDSRRIGSLKNCGHILSAKDTLYAARKNECWSVDARTGEKGKVFTVPAVDAETRDWGYLDLVGGLLIGSAQKIGASFSRMSDLTCDILEGDNRLVMDSDYLFALDAKTGDVAWTYKNGAILNNALAAADGRIYLMESRNPDALQDKDGRVELRKFCASATFVVALDAATGKTLWERPITVPFQHIAYLNTAEGVVLISGTHNEGSEVYYSFFALAADSGKDLWNSKFRALDIRGKQFSEVDGSHGEQWQHPVLTGGALYARPFAFDLHTGAKKDYKVYRGGHGCGGFTGSKHYLYGRGDNPRMYPLDTQETEGMALTGALRPGCWLNMIPAGGLVLLPESSSGCTCAYAIQTSIAFVPQAIAQSVP